MRKIDIREAKTHLSRLVDEAATGEPFIIAKAGRSMVKVMSIDAPSQPEASRLGFMRGELEWPDDFDRMGQQETEDTFGARS